MLFKLQNLLFVFFLIHLLSGQKKPLSIPPLEHFHHRVATRTFRRTASQRTFSQAYPMRHSPILSHAFRLRVPTPGFSCGRHPPFVSKHVFHRRWHDCAPDPAVSPIPSQPSPLSITLPLTPPGALVQAFIGPSVFFTRPDSHPICSNLHFSRIISGTLACRPLRSLSFFVTHLLSHGKPLPDGFLRATLTSLQHSTRLRRLPWNGLTSLPAVRDRASNAPGVDRRRSFRFSPFSERIFFFPRAIPREPFLKRTFIVRLRCSFPPQATAHASLRFELCATRPHPVFFPYHLRMVANACRPKIYFLAFFSTKKKKNFEISNDL